MIANLPLLFAGGNPVALTKCTGSQLERFITFMVTCSWGHDTAGDIVRPEWWPGNVPYSHPFVRPAVVALDWEERLRSLVRKCYTFHNSSFLLVFSAQLARYPRRRLHYVDNLDATTSLYLKPSGRLLVTFRNQNMYYDRDTLDDTILIDDENEIVIEDLELETDIPAKSANIYLCDNCDSHFDNVDTLSMHERLCNTGDSAAGCCNGGLPDFLSALKLQPINSNSTNPDKNHTKDNKSKSSRSAANPDRGPLYPFSSLAYMKHIKNHIQRDTSYIRERVERYCCTTLPSKIVVNKMKNQQFPVRYRRPIDYWHRNHVFPEQRKKKILSIKGQLLHLKCKRITVDVERMSLTSMQEYINKLKEEAEIKQKTMQEKDIIFVDMSCASADVESKHADPLKPNSECEVIDLCSDDEGSAKVDENCDPRCGVTCVMRGGAVLRRTAATPQAERLPAEPCGARQRPLSSAVLQPHPVLLITRTLNTLQTISLE